MNDRIEKARMQYIYDDGEEYPQEAIEISEREEIMQDSKENFRKAIEDNLPLPPSVSEMIKKREKKSKSMNQKHHSDIIDKFLADLRHLKSQSEEVEKTSEYVIEKIISFVCFKIEMIGVVSKRREDEFVGDLRDYLTDLLRSSEAEGGEKQSEEVSIRCPRYGIWIGNPYEADKLVNGIAQPSEEKGEERYRATECDDKDCLCHQVKPNKSNPKK